MVSGKPKRIRSEEHKARQRERAREKYWENPELSRMKKREKHVRNRESIAARKREKYREDIEKSREQERIRGAKRYAKKREEINARKREWYKRNRDKQLEKIYDRRYRRDPTIGIESKIREYERGDIGLDELNSFISERIAFLDEKALRGIQRNEREANQSKLPSSNKSSDSSSLRKRNQQPSKDPG